MLYDSAIRSSLSPQQRRLGYVFQDYALFPHLTVRQNIAFGTPQRLAATRRAASTIRRSSAGSRPFISSRSRGTIRIRSPAVSVSARRWRARSSPNPTALLLDEPFAALDKGLRERLRQELRDLLAEIDLPMLLITHDDDDVLSLAEEVVQMSRGRVDGAAPGLALVAATTSTERAATAISPLTSATRHHAARVDRMAGA